MPILGLDVSGYQDPERMNYKELYEHGVRFVFVKLGQHLTEEHVDLARAAGLEVGGYWWDDPLLPVAYQVSEILKEMARLALRFGALDVEQFWSDWAAYWLYCQHKISLDQVPRLPAALIASHAGAVMAQVKAAIKVPWLVYTGEWMVKGVAPLMQGWIDLYDQWLAQYIRRSGPMTWIELGLLPGSLGVRSVGNKRPKIWQISSTFVFPGRSCSDCYDTDLFLGEQADLDRWLGFPAPAPAFEPYPAQAFAYPWLRIRSTPKVLATNIIGKVLPGSKPVTILEECDGFGRFALGWISLAWIRKV